MNHLFSKSDNGNCATCDRNYLSHTPAARCDSCQKCGICNVVDDLLLCDTCADKIKNNQFDLIERSRAIDSAIGSNQDFYNAETISLIDLRASIDANTEVVNKDDAFKQEILLRYEKFSIALFELDTERFKTQLQLSIIKKSLDETAGTLRADERERIKIADANYVPPAKNKPVKPRVAKADKKSIFEQMVENFAKMNGISETEARITLQQGMNKLNKKID